MAARRKAKANPKPTKGEKGKARKNTAKAPLRIFPPPHALEPQEVSGDDDLETPHAQFPVVGIGASAGGLAAFKAFFSGFPKGKRPNMAFVLVQHLAPDQRSILPELVRGFTDLDVFEVEDGMLVRPNCVFVIPPGRDLALLNGAFKLMDPTAPRALRLPIDFFFRSLAQDQNDQAIGIVLSGTGSDGAGGVRAIKGAGGLVMVQNAAEFDGMPRSAIATDAVDFELPPEEMGARLAAYVAHRGPRVVATAPPGVESTLKSIFVLLRAQTGHDFSQYKPSTLHRRIERRMAVHQVQNIESYLKFLQQTPAEVDALFRDLLIGVTNFFRDDVAFKALEDAIPALCAHKPTGSVLRVWVAGCSTGEEAYSLAMLLTEHLETSKRRLTVQIFATDIDSRAIAAARAGFYSAGAAADVSPDRLSRFFTAEPGGGGYRIKKSIREQVVFSEHDLLKDPPFSRLDLLSCRNVLIYLGSELQKRLIPLFHYALRPEGLLLLGTSEGAGDFDSLFDVLDRKAKLYQRRPDQVGLARAGVLSPMNQLEITVPKKHATPAKASTRELVEQALLRQLAPVCALVNAHGDLLYLHGRTGMFLEPSPGEAGASNILKMAREGLRTGLSATIHRSASKGALVKSTGLRVKTNGHYTLVDVTVFPVTQEPGVAELRSPLFLVLLAEAPVVEGKKPAAQEKHEQTIDARIAALKEELRVKEEHLQRASEELESSTEELKSSNEEMQSVNEELQSTNEELETSKEELQSVNEELATVNAELQAKVNDLSRANSDMNSLLAGTGIATVFVDQQLKILRFTPAAQEITNLIQSDVGRPISHIVSNLVGYSQLAAHAADVLATLRSREVEVQAVSGRWYSLRIQPYRTIENVIEGVVMSFLDITDRVQTREALRKVNEVLRLAVVVRDSHDALTVQDMQGRTLAWNPGAERLYGWTESEALAMWAQDRVPPQERAAEAERVARVMRGELTLTYEGRKLTKAGEAIRVSVVATALLDQTGATYAIATTERSIE